MPVGARGAVEPRKAQKRARSSPSPRHREAEKRLLRFNAAYCARARTKNARITEYRRIFWLYALFSSGARASAWLSGAPAAEF
jgi:hypothetical protein